MNSGNSISRLFSIIGEASSVKLAFVCLVLAFCISAIPYNVHAQEGTDVTTTDEQTESFEGSSGQGEDAVQPSGMEKEGITGDESYELSPGVVEDIEQGMENLLGITGDETVEPFDLSVDDGEGFDLSTSEGEPFELSGYEPEPFELSVSDEEFELPAIEIPDFDSVDVSAGEEERTIFNTRPWNEYYAEVISGAPSPDITRLGPLPEILEEGIDFTDIAADWIYHQKSAGLTELNGHVMIVYDTTIISCDEAVLDEESEVYHFFGEGRVFVDDADFNLECDELEIHDAEGEKMIYILGQSTLVVYADEDAVEPGPDASRRERLEYALKQEDTTITFTDAEYDYENDVFDAHNGVRFEQPDKYAEGDEFHGENESEYMHFTGNCEFWQVDGQWLYEHRLVEDQEDPPSKGDRVTRALLSVPTTITCDEAEASGEIGWVEMRSYGENVVYFHQDDKHAECTTFTLWHSDEEESATDSDGGDAEFEELDPDTRVKPPGFGALTLASEIPDDYFPWEHVTVAEEDMEYSIFDGDLTIGLDEDGELPVEEEVIDGEPGEEISADEPETTSEEDQGGLTSEQEEQLEGVIDGLSDSGILEEAGIEEEVVEEVIEEFLQGDEGIELPGVNMEGLENLEFLPFGDLGIDIPGVVDEPEVSEDETGPVGSLSDLTGEDQELVTGEAAEEEPEGPRNEIIMDGNVFFRQENGDWLFEYNVFEEGELEEEDEEQYRKWANGQCDYFHVWTKKELIEATGNVHGEQENQDFSSDFLRYLGELDMLYVRGNVIAHREGKHEILTNEGFLFFSTKVFEALGAVQTTVTVDVEEQRQQAQTEDEGEVEE